MTPKRPLALVTRPQPDARRLADALLEIDVESLIAPVLEILPVPDVHPDLEGVTGLLFTSANGVRAFAVKETARHLPVFAVGDRTAAMAREAGFRQVLSAGGDVEDLARLVAREREGQEGALLHVAGKESAGDLAGLLTRSGFPVRRQVLYRAMPVEALAEDAVIALQQRRIDLAPFLSPRTAKVFVNLAAGRGLQSDLGAVTAVCLSQAVERELDGSNWKSVIVAPEPTLTALISACAAW